MTFTITDFGAVGNGKTLNTAAIQSAIDACTAAGGGRVTVPAGKFLSGTILLLRMTTGTPAGRAAASSWRGTRRM